MLIKVLGFEDYFEDPQTSLKRQPRKNQDMLIRVILRKHKPKQIFNMKHLKY